MIYDYIYIYIYIYNISLSIHIYIYIYGDSEPTGVSRPTMITGFQTGPRQAYVLQEGHE